MEDSRILNQATQHSGNWRATRRSWDSQGKLDGQGQTRSVRYGHYLGRIRIGDRAEWHKLVAQCIHLDVGWTEVLNSYSNLYV